MKANKGGLAGLYSHAAMASAHVSFGDASGRMSLSRRMTGHIGAEVFDASATEQGLRLQLDVNSAASRNKR
jgi:hypothetical protein